MADLIFWSQFLHTTAEHCCPIYAYWPIYYCPICCFALCRWSTYILHSVSSLSFFALGFAGTSADSCSLPISHLASCHTELVTRYVTATELLPKTLSTSGRATACRLAPTINTVDSRGGCLLFGALLNEERRDVCGTMRRLRDVETLSHILTLKVTKHHWRCTEYRFTQGPKIRLGPPYGHISTYTCLSVAVL